MGNLGPAAKPAVSDLTNHLLDANEQVVFVLRSVAQALGNIGPDASGAIPALERALKMPRVTYTAQEAIQKIKGEPVATWYSEPAPIPTICWIGLIVSRTVEAREDNTGTRLAKSSHVVSVLHAGAAPGAGAETTQGWTTSSRSRMVPGALLCATRMADPMNRNGLRRSPLALQVDEHRISRWTASIDPVDARRVFAGGRFEAAVPNSPTFWLCDCHEGRRV